MKIQITENDINKMVKSCVNRILNEGLYEGDLNNAAQRIAVIRNIYAKHHKEDPSFTFNDAVEWYKKNHQENLEHRREEFTRQDVSDEIEDFKKSKASKPSSLETTMETVPSSLDYFRRQQEKNKKIELFRQNHDKHVEFVEKTMELIRLNPSVWQSGGCDARIKAQIGETKCDAEGIPQEFVEMCAKKALFVFNKIKESGFEEGIEEYGKSINVYIPGSDSGSAWVVYGNNHRMRGLGKDFGANELYSEIEDEYSYDEIKDKIDSVTSILEVRCSPYDIEVSLRFNAEFNEEGNEMIRRYNKMADDSVEHERSMGWSLD